MCGITGAVWFDPSQRIAPEIIDRMTDVLIHRGPDDRGQYYSEFQSDAAGCTPGVGLGFRRLSIIDLAGGHQPMSNEDESIWMVFNGEVYNYKQLRHRLDGTGHYYRTDCDAESVIHLYEDLGTDCFQHLNGMFAVAIWDRNRRQLVLARDRLGKKPLFYQLSRQQLLFGSELKALAQAPTFQKEVSAGAIAAFLTYQYVPHPQSIYRHTRKVAPGHYVVFRQRDVAEKQVRKYWNFDASIESSLPAAEAAGQVTELFHDSIQLRLQSDVPLGAFLSGGIDSSLVVALAQQHSLQPIKTFSIGFRESDFDERPYARQVAAWVQSQHHEAIVEASAVDTLEQLVTHYDEPFGDSSALPTWHLCKWAREHVKVALTGDGGDELFAGYDRHRALWLSRWLNQAWPMTSILGSGWFQRLPNSDRQRSLVRQLQRFGAVLKQPPVRRYMNWVQIFPEQIRAELYQDDFLQQLPDEDPIQFFETAWQQAGNRDLVSRASLADLVTYLPCDLMNKIDIASMAHSLECRQPFLDYRLVELAARIPSRLKLGWSSGKLLLRTAFDRHLPRQVWTRRKMGVGIPLGRWLRGELAGVTRQTLLSPESRCHTLFRPAALKKLIDQHAAGQFNHEYRIWNLLILEAWLRRWQ
ncbi:MAG TPA: asparagine synthase (glutamine-hydrolyzing) [Planctomycetaceae bacterium]|nr:asparagine synthase (glutamine-hydrolyzing) [Planctomycetaceae bacterium]